MPVEPPGFICLPKSRRGSDGSRMTREARDVASRFQRIRPLAILSPERLESVVCCLLWLLWKWK